MRCSLSAAVACAAGCAQKPLAQQRGGQDDVQLSEATSAGMLAFDHGDLQTATALYARALQRAHLIGDAASIAAAAYNLAACDVAGGQFDLASSHLREAKYEASSADISADDILLLTAKLDYLQQRDGEAAEVVQSLTASKSSLVRIQGQTLLTLIACDGKQSATAAAQLALLTKMTVAEKDMPASITADIEKAQGEVAQLAGTFPEAAAHLDFETKLLRAAGRYPDQARSLARAGSAYERAGQLSTAADRYYHAAQIYVGFEDRISAKQFATRAMAAANASGGAELARLAEDLLRSVSPTTAP